MNLLVARSKPNTEQSLSLHPSKNKHNSSLSPNPFPAAPNNSFFLTI